MIRIVETYGVVEIRQRQQQGSITILRDNPVSGTKNNDVSIL